MACVKIFLQMLFQKLKMCGVLKGPLDTQRMMVFQKSMFFYGKYITYNNNNTAINIII